MDFFGKLNIKDIIDYFSYYVPYKSPLEMVRTLIDIGIVSYIIYKIVQLVRETRAWQLLKGILFILIAAQLSAWLRLSTLAYILNESIKLASFAFIVLFQPELRRGLEQIGRSKLKDFFTFEVQNNTLQTTVIIEEMIKAVVEMSRTYTGALIVVERETKIGEVINSGIQLDSNVTSELILNIFTPNTPLHDGAVVIRDNKIKAAACFLPLTDNPNLSKELGTRHRSALGITEVSDCIAIVVSEETGTISFALNGGLTRNLTSDTLRKALSKNLLEKNTANKKLGLWKVKSK